MKMVLCMQLMALAALFLGGAAALLALWRAALLRRAAHSAAAQGAVFARTLQQSLLALLLVLEIGLPLLFLLLSAI